MVVPVFPPRDSVRVFRSLRFCRNLPAFGWIPSVCTLCQQKTMNQPKTPATENSGRWLGASGDSCGRTGNCSSRHPIEALDGSIRLSEVRKRSSTPRNPIWSTAADHLIQRIWQQCILRRKRKSHGLSVTIQLTMCCPADNLTFLSVSHGQTSRGPGFGTAWKRKS